MSALAVRSHGPPSGSATYYRRSDKSTKGRSVLTSIDVRVHPWDARQPRNQRAPAHATPTSLRYGKRKWHVSKHQPAPLICWGTNPAVSDALTCATARRSLSKRPPGPDDTLRAGDLSPVYHEDSFVAWSANSSRGHGFEPAPCFSQRLCLSAGVPTLPLDRVQRSNPGSLAPADQDTVAPRGSPRGAWAAQPARQDGPASSGPWSPPAEHVLSRRADPPSSSVSEFEGASEDGPCHFGTYRGGGGGGSQPSTTGTQGFPQYVTAGPDVSLFGHSLFGYEASDLQDGIVWA